MACYVVQIAAVGRQKDPVEETLGNQLQATLARNPEQVSALYRDAALSNAALLRNAGGLAEQLRRMGATRGVNVGLYSQRNLSLLESTLAIIFSGATCVPLDPTYPTAVLTSMVEDANLAILITDDPEETRHLGVAEKRTLDLNKYRHHQVASAKPAMESQDPRDIAFITYTSGSTGKPKGVAHTHAGILEKARLSLAALDATAKERWCLLTPISFVAFIHQFVIPILAGITTVVVSHEDAINTRMLAGILDSYNITTLTLTPSWVAALLAEPRYVNNRTLRVVICGGEPMPARIRKQHLEALPARLLMVYGCTELPWAATHECQLDEPERMIGHAAAGVEIFLLDEKQNQVAAGEPGEIYVGGAGLAHGYWQNASKTGNVFVNLPGSVTTRCYRTGDVARQTSRGLQFLGRVDQLVNVRGAKVSLAGLEKTLMTHPNISQAVAVIHTNQSDRTLLAVYWTSDRAPAPSVIDLRKWVASQLPSAMMPNRFIQIDEFPMTPSGKVDVGALKTALAATGKAAGQPPQSCYEQQLAAIWEALLDLTEVHVDDQFFSLGGNSILAVEAIARFEQDSGYRVEGMDMFLLTLGQIAALAEDNDC